MRRLGISPKFIDFINQTGFVTDWFTTAGERLNVYSGAADPSLSEVPEGQWVVFHNTALNEVRIWTNIAGILVKSAAFT